ncbi:hypothetical protein [Marixanthomonas spongiae]|uniref:Lipoprotein n=1 Tax=Marixanthomonas spongiae TaxID=2174845 RepID=A0A2U0I107_9FLAO|nr:hypothetical protein [Marixanthomonas spongiae]PVW14680.1 hypothetical protein DDV96_09175 [Marixanthomonas spongiae]
MKRSKIVTVHIIATCIAVMTISCFFSFSLLAEILGNEVFIKQVKTAILYCLPILLICMPVLALSGKKLAGNSKSSIVAKKLKRMKLVAINGVILISLAIYLYYHAIFKTIDTTFLLIQILELLFGAINLGLIGLNIQAGLKLSGRMKKRRI